MIRESGHELKILAQERETQEFLAEFPDSDAVVAMLSDQISADMIQSAKHLRIISNYAVGYNNIDLKACSEKKIVVTNTPDVLTEATADIAMTLTLMAARNIYAGQKQLYSGNFLGWRPSGMLGLDLYGKKFGIVGLGRIGIATAKRAEAFGMRVLYHTRSGPKPLVSYPYVPLESLLCDSDVISLHTPLTPETCRMIGRKELNIMKKNAILINTARGPLIDESALADALESGRIFAAGLDVYEEEPKVHPRLLKLENVALLPHMGSATVETRTKMGEIAAQAVIDVLAGVKPAHPVNLVL
ncbi:MAG: D-glycerate dehydrogenase [Candidatus Riflebacteria bacterium]|nr:D-glycerate dehydrogenase [Candidatus Riflebacteria bacterium]